MSKRYPFIVLVLLISFIILSGCGKSVPPIANSTSPVSAGAAANIKTGNALEIAKSSVGDSGGIIAVTGTDNPLTGLVLTIPPHAFSAATGFTVSYAPIEKHTFGANFNPVTPLIIVQNGGSFSEGLMTVKIPVKVPSGHFAMGFYYDEKSGKLEGMPLLAADSESVTLVTRHFSSFVVSSIPETRLTGNVDTGFKPGVDDWQMDNTGTIVVGGQCAGQSISSIWYYQEKPDGANAHLFNRYDNNGDQNFKTPDLIEDDSLALKLVTSLQLDYEEHNLAQERKFRELNTIDDATTYKAFVNSMLTTGSPQLLVTSHGNGGHALVAYKIVNGSIFVADPNSPGDPDVTYKYNAETAKFVSNSTVNYVATSALVSWQQIAQRWAELKNGTIGNDRYPTYDIMVLGEKGNWSVLKDGYISKTNKVTLRVVPSPGIGNAEFMGPYFKGFASTRIDANTREVPLQPGNNRLGVRVLGKITTKLEGTNWAGFKYYNVVFSAVTIDPAALEGAINKDYTFTAKTENLLENSKFVWAVNGAQMQSNTSPVFTTKFTTSGDYTVGVKIVGADGKEIASATASAAIKTAPTTPAENKLQRLQARTKLKGNLNVKGAQSWVNVARPAENTTKVSDFRMSYTFDKITWQETSFQGTLDTGSGWWMTISGTASADGASITNMKVILHPDKTRPDYISTWTIELGNVPLDFTTSKTIVQYQGQGPSVRNYVTKVENYTRTMTGTPATLKSELKLESVNWSDNAFLNFQFE